MSTFAECRLKCMGVPVMNTSTATCMDNHAIEREVIRGISDKLEGCDQFNTL